MKCAVSLSTSSSGKVVRYWQYHRPTPVKCACCGHTAKENRQSQSQFECLECGYTANADINGARNI
nr:transposase [Proteus mirabilis]